MSLSHPQSGCVGILTTRGFWYRVCPSRTVFGLQGSNRRGAAVLTQASLKPWERRA